MNDVVVYENALGSSVFQGPLALPSALLCAALPPLELTVGEKQTAPAFCELVESYCLPYNKFRTPTSRVHIGGLHLQTDTH
jgi:hypothetical protein